jgi:hypothetical protein
MLAALAAACTLVGAALVTAAVVATRPLWSGGYISEAGVATAPGASRYRWGILLLAAALALLALAVAPTSRAAAVLLGLAAGVGVLSGSVQCSAGCPLPPYESATTADLIHGGSSIVAVAASGLAMAVLALSRTRTPIRTLSRVAFCLVGPLGLAVGLGILFIGRGPATATLERAILVTEVLWMFLAAIELLVPRRVATA